jgi:hypothetical protein
MVEIKISGVTGKKKKIGQRLVRWLTFYNEEKKK